MEVEICRWCGQEILLYGSLAKAWGHVPSGVMVCRDKDGEFLNPMTWAEPLIWKLAEVAGRG